MPAHGKRKRVDYESSDEDYPLGKQVLPVANLPEDFDGSPMDGAQYLFIVRRDCRLLPHTTRVPNPYEQDIEPKSTTISTSPTVRPVLPSDEWRATVERRFRNFRMNVAQPTIRVSLPLGTKVMPDKKDRDSWWAFLAGKPESEWNRPKKAKVVKNKDRYKRGMRAFADEQAQDESSDTTETWRVNEDGEVEPVADVDLSEPVLTPDERSALRSDGAEIATPEARQKQREPTPLLLQHIDGRMSVHLLMYFTHWINLDVQQADRAQVTETHARWMFALLTRIEDFISADDMNLLRNLARACLSLLKQHIQRRVMIGGVNEVRSLIFGEETPGCMGERSCWMIISIIVGVWAQRDLWVDAEGTLSDIGTHLE